MGKAAKNAKKDKYLEMNFDFSETDDEADSDEEEDEEREGGKVFAARFTMKTVNCVNHLGFRLGEIGGDDELYEELAATLWKGYDGEEEEEEPDSNSGGFRGLSTRHTPDYWHCFEKSLDTAKKALDGGRFPHAFNVCMSMTVNFRMEDHWMRDTEDLVHGVILTNRLFGLWEHLLPKSDEELDIGGGETRQVVAESIRALHNLVKQGAAAGGDDDEEGYVTHSYVYNHKKTKLTDPKSFLSAA